MFRNEVLKRPTLYRVAIGVLLVASLVIVTLSHTTYEMKVHGVVTSLSFSVIEYLYTYKDTGRGKTTFEQVFINMLTLPVALKLFRVLTDQILFPYVARWAWTEYAIRIALFPILVWFVELWEAFVLWLLFGYNPAWDYSKSSASLFWGAIDYRMWVDWMTLGITMEAIYWPLMDSVLKSVPEMAGGLR